MVLATRQRVSVRSDRDGGRLQTTSVALDPKTATIALRLTRDATRWPLATRVQARIVVVRDGERFRAEAVVTGGLLLDAVGAEITATVLTYTLPWGFFGARRTGDLPKRLGETAQTEYVAWAEIEALEGAMAADLDMASVEAEAPRIPFHSSIAFDAASSATLSGPGTLSWSHTVAAGSDRCLVIGYSDYGWITNATNVTYNAVAATSVSTATNGNGPVASLWRLVAPDTGANTVSMDVTSQVTSSGGAVSYTGVDQTTPFGTAATATGASTTPSVVVSSASGELVVDALSSGGNTPTAGAGQTSRIALANFFGMSEEAGAASVTMSWTTDTSNEWAIVGAPLKAAAAGSSILRQMLMQ